MTINKKLLTAALLRDECGYRAYERGNNYFNQGRATLIETVADDQNTLILYTTNRGSGRRIYDQQIYLQLNSGGLEIDGYCDCPMEYNCKHVVAGCLAWKAQAGPPNADADFEQWLTRLDAPPPSEGNAAEALIYQLAPAGQLGGREHTLQLYLSIAKRKRDGDWGKGRRVSLSTLNSHHYTTTDYIQPIDMEILTFLRAGNPYHWGEDVPLQGMAGRTALELMLESGRLYFGGSERLGPLYPSAPRALQLKWKKHSGMYHLAVGSDETMQVIAVDPPHYLDRSRLSIGPLELPEGITADKLEMLQQAPPVDTKDAGRISRLLALRHPELPTPEALDIKERREPPQPRLSIRFNPESPGSSTIVLDFIYGGQAIALTKTTPILIIERGSTLLHFHRDMESEGAAVDTLQKAGLHQLTHTPDNFSLNCTGVDRHTILAEWFRFSDEVLPQLQQQGWLIEQTESPPFTLSYADGLDAEVERSENDWFGLRFDLMLGDTRLPLLPLVSQLLSDYRPGGLPETLYLDTGAGHYVAVAAERIEPVLQTIIDLYDRDSGDGDSLRLSRLDAPRLLEFGDIRVRGGSELQQLAKRLRDFDGIKAAKIPTTFKGELRAYQQQGVNWLQFLRDYGLAGILADDMGLGKTVQTLAHLAIEKRAGRMRLPSLIVAPTSLMGNWRREAAQFTPGLKVLVLHGPNRANHFDTLHTYDLVLTTYPLLPRDTETLLAQSWHCLILDEAQQIKNPKSQAAQLVRELHANHRLCLTGTPMENHLGELWAQFDFLLPGFLGTQEQFSRTYRTPIEREGSSDQLQRLTRRTTPFMLRRTKDLVASELPQKSELLRTTPIAGKQATLYESIRLTMEKKVRDAIASKGLARSHITILDALLKLRQVCCDPRLLPAGTRGAKGAQSAKLAMLKEMLPELLDEGRRILLFSQFTTMLGLIEDEVRALDIPYTKLTGQTRKREEAIERFRSGAANLFLISLKAGGVGLNLTEADTVIHYDPWWNPAVEAQATDRTHRIGQDKPVFVYKLITEGTVEEKILALQLKKKQLADSVYGKGRGATELPIDAATISALLES